jgi:hypothetical protein
MKDEGSNVHKCVTILNSIVSCNSLAMFEPFDGFILGMDYLKLVNMLLLMKTYLKGCTMQT